MPSSNLEKSDLEVWNDLTARGIVIRFFVANRLELSMKK
jgi:hypothetical protein